MYTNVLSPLHWNFSGDTIPDALKDTHAPRFAFNNPVALQKKYLKLKGDPSMSIERAYLRQEVKSAQQGALDMLVDFFDWLDSLEAQPMTESGSLYETVQTIDATTTNILAQMDQAATRTAEIDEQRKVFQETSAVSYPPDAWFLCSLNEGHGGFLPLREDSQYSRLEAGAHPQPQISLQRA